MCDILPFTGEPKVTPKATGEACEVVNIDDYRTHTITYVLSMDCHGITAADTSGLIGYPKTSLSARIDELKAEIEVGTFLSGGGGYYQEPEYKNESAWDILKRLINKLMGR